MQTQEIELHDSEVSSLIHVGSGMRMDLRLYVHRYEGERHSGWIQGATLVLTDVEGESPSEWPADISDGSMTVNSELFDNTIPISLNAVGKVTLNLTLTTGEKLSLRAQGAVLTFSGEPIYLEELPF